MTTVVLPPLATLDDLDALGVTGDPAHLTRLLDAASAAARDWCGWSISFQADELLPGRYAGKVTTLPSLWLLDVKTVTVNGTQLDTIPPWLPTGLLQYESSPFGRLEALCDHGYEPIPADVSLAVAGMVSRASSAPAGVSQERLGAWSVSYRDGSVAVDMTASAGLAPYKLPSVP